MIKLLFAGDIYVQQEEFCLDGPLQELFSSSDIVSCNLEGPLISRGFEPESKAGPVICQPETVGHFLSSMGFNLFSLANNHIYDYGKVGLDNTLKILHDKHTVGAGMSSAEAYKLKTIIIDDTVLGFLSLAEAEFGYVKSENSTDPGFAWVNDPVVLQIISESKRNVNILFVQVHAGIEKTPLPLPEWRSRYKELCDAGADVIIGHHPHVSQGWEIYKDKYIFYSLGNFFFDIDKIKTSGYIVQFILKQRKILKFEITPVCNKKNYICIDENKNKTLLQLCKLLTDNYIEQVNKLAVERWYKYYLPYFGYSLKSILLLSLFQNIIYMFRRLIAMKYINYIDNNLLLHNIRIESHRWLSIRALECINKKKVT